MESNKNDINNGGDEHQHQQLRRNTRKRTFNELANDVDDDQPADEDQQQEPQNCNKKNRGEQRGNDSLENLHLESLTREELIQLVQKQNEAHKHLETTAGNSAKQAEEFCQRNIKLEQEKAEVQEDLHQKMDEIVKMQKEAEEKSEKLSEKAKQIDALLIQLKETSHQHQIGLSTEEEMKVQLSLETWFDMLAFVPRHHLGKIVPKIGDRKFASIAQKFLHEYGEITIDEIQIVAPYEEDPSGHPRVRTVQNNRPLRFEMADAPMPANIKNFDFFELRYFDQSVLNFMQKFQQNGLLDNVTLAFGKLPSKNILHQALSHLLPLINGIVLIDVMDSAQLADFYDAANSKEIYELYMKMMEETRFLGADYDPQNLQPNTIDLYCRWLYQTARKDGKPRVLQFGSFYMDSTPISLFIDRIKQDFLMAKNPLTFFIRIILPKSSQPQEDICFDNGKTKERFQAKMEKAKVQEKEWEGVVLLISRYSLASTKKWIEENEKEVLNLSFSAGNDNRRTIYLSEE